MQEKSIFDYFKSTLTDNYANFSGRARRKEYWSFQLVVFIISLVLMAIDAFAFGAKMGQGGILGSIFSLATIVPSLGLLVRRLHDVGKSGWFFFIILIPIIGAIWLLVLFFTDGEAGSNEYGANPKNPETELDSIGSE
ncbi:MAG: DUF805 domain-containing protein [Bacteroidia bacterium]|jgi:uncharacterized membrane protein YhaH (DUF805 family)|tara:strand:- start:1773 stop:2186 length:414 start_codon:yes stop_codon:yes gene_type:complete